jgi:hypothetical protein
VCDAAGEQRPDPGRIKAMTVRGLKSETARQPVGTVILAVKDLPGGEAIGHGQDGILSLIHDDEAKRPVQGTKDCLTLGKIGPQRGLRAPTCGVLISVEKYGDTSLRGQHVGRRRLNLDLPGTQPSGDDIIARQMPLSGAVWGPDSDYERRGTESSHAVAILSHWEL